MSFKRVRHDGQVTRGEYDLGAEAQSSGPGTFSRASIGTLHGRRMVSARHIDKRLEYVKHAMALNSTFCNWFNDQISANPGACLSTGAQNWLDYRDKLEERYLRVHGEVLTWGSGDCGQLAHGTEDEADLSVKFPRVVYSLRDKKVCLVACGGLHNAVVTECGEVYTWGCSDDGSLGRTGDESIPLKVEGLPADDPVIGADCGDGQTVVVTAGGSVYAWGCFKDKEGKKWFSPAQGSADPKSTIKRQEDVPLKVQGLSGIVEVACGASFCVGLGADGRAWTWGLGECGELGRAVRPMKPDGPDGGYDHALILTEHLTPAPMVAVGSSGNAIRNVRAVGCGAYHTLVVTGSDNSGKPNPQRDGLYTTGLSNYGQLGLGDTANKELLQLVDCPEFYLDMSTGESDTVLSACGGMHHSVCLMSSGRVFAFGRADYGQLGIARPTGKKGEEAGAFESTPGPVVVDAWGSGKSTQEVARAGKEKIVSLASGGSHNLALTADGQLYSWGYGDMLALGHGREEDQPTPLKVNLAKTKLDMTVRQVAAGGQHSALVGNVRSADKP